MGRRSCFCHVLRDWRVVALEDNGGDLTFPELFKGIQEHRFDSHEMKFAMRLQDADCRQSYNAKLAT